MSSFLPFGATNPRPAKIDNTAGVNTANSAEPVLGNSTCLLSWAFGASATAGASSNFSAGFSSVAAWVEFADVLGLIPAGLLVLGACWARASSGAGVPGVGSGFGVGYFSGSGLAGLSDSGNLYSGLSFTRFNQASLSAFNSALVLSNSPFNPSTK